jgi:hypothetical protein
MANRDPRHNGRFAEAFALGYAIRVLDANLECLTLSALTGPFGLVAGKGEPTEEGGRRPLFSVIKLLSSLAGSAWNGCTSSHPSEVLAFRSGSTLYVVNLTAVDQTIDISAFASVPQGTDMALAAYTTTMVKVFS